MMAAMAKLVVEIHVPLVPAPDVPAGEYAYPWIDDVEDHLAGLEEAGRLEVHDEGEEVDGDYVYFVTGAAQDQLLEVASQVADREGVPAGAYAVLSSDDAEEIGVGERVDLPL